jgi:threonine dehydrogenase-like Zn-dependent dehydrogenase
MPYHRGGFVIADHVTGRRFEMSGTSGLSEAHALFYVGRRRAVLNPVKVSAPGEGEALVRTLWSGISRGTERLVFEGGVPLDDEERMRAPMQEGDFPFPVKYGYCAVGVVEDGPATLLGREVFCLHPHQDRFTAPVEMITPLPEGLPARRAILAANMETALNGVWDSHIGPGARVVVVGGGAVGLLIGAIVAQIPGVEATLVDIDASRRDLVESFGCAFTKPLDAPEDADVVFHASASDTGLACALACAGLEATVVEMSWYGSDTVAAPLGLNFHSRRLRLISSQVGEIAPAFRPRWSHRRRLEKALSLLCDDRFDALITEESPFLELPETLPRLLAPGAPGLCTAIRYA